MTRSRHVGLEQAETTVLDGRNRRRAALEEQLLVALADADREEVSRLRSQLDHLLRGSDLTVEPARSGGRPPQW